MKIPSFSEFAALARAEGYDEVLERTWPAGSLVETHAHPFALRALVVAGEMWLTIDDHCRHLRRGDAFALDKDLAHSERYGDEGATYWVARRVAPANRS
ncbi:MAG: AraC family ligand binding domain-containing protein [Azonexus sp.]|nr:AraC family ligand binding domain-containing protein [Betaproteobacteria bacterium]MBK8916749.1 AraC family ligand binding domain-containing protein [Betaproteobacteria bacterium]MBP6036673.1 AraC family ligand binding domain-containing protein [Azonexus sp.]MBP6907282.1 AraC family ligand binding domain-containing protein [Azonexus sp.]